MIKFTWVDKAICVDNQKVASLNLLQGDGSQKYYCRGNFSFIFQMKEVKLVLVVFFSKLKGVKNNYSKI